MRARTNAEATQALKLKVANENKKDRQGDNRSKLYYVKMEYDATKLDEIFGPENWTSEILDQGSRVWEQTLISFKQNQREEYKARVASAWATVRLTVTFPDGKKTFRDGVGAGDAIRRADNPNSVEAEGLALKAAGTDAIKRAAALFGNIFGRGMEKDGLQRYDYDYTPPEEDEGDLENRPTPTVSADHSDVEVQRSAPTNALPATRPSQADTRAAAPQSRYQDQGQGRAQVRQSEAAPQSQPTSRVTPRQESTITSGMPRSGRGNGQGPANHDRNQASNRNAPADEFETALNGASVGIHDPRNRLSEHLRLLIPVGNLLEIGAPERWKNIFSDLNDVRKNWLTTSDDVATMKAHLKDFRSRAEQENIITGSSAGAKEIRHYFDTMDIFVDRRLQQIVEAQAA